MTGLARNSLCQIGKYLVRWLEMFQGRFDSVYASREYFIRIHATFTVNSVTLNWIVRNYIPFELNLPGPMKSIVDRSLVNVLYHTFFNPATDCAFLFAKFVWFHYFINIPWLITLLQVFFPVTSIKLYYTRRCVIVLLFGFFRKFASVSRFYYRSNMHETRIAWLLFFVCFFLPLRWILPIVLAVSSCLFISMTYAKQWSKITWRIIAEWH